MGIGGKNMGFDIPHMTNFAKRILKGFKFFPWDVSGWPLTVN